MPFSISYMITVFMFQKSPKFLVTKYFERDERSFNLPSACCSLPMYVINLWRSYILLRRCHISIFYVLNKSLIFPQIWYQSYCSLLCFQVKSQQKLLERVEQLEIANCKKDKEIRCLKEKLSNPTVRKLSYLSPASYKFATIVQRISWGIVHLVAESWILAFAINLRFQNFWV